MFTTLNYTIKNQINKALEEENQKPRATPKEKRLSPSSFDTCEVKMWYRYHRTSKEKHFDGDILKRFQLGTDQEEGTIKLLRMIGFDLVNKNEQNEQFGFTAFDGKMVGYCDGIINSGKLDLPYPILFEHKIMKSSKFLKVSNEGVQKSNPNYYTQMQLYLGFMEYKNCLFVSYNTDTSDIYSELVEYDNGFFISLMNTTEKVFAGDNLIKDTKYCNWCEYQEACNKKFKHR